MMDIEWETKLDLGDLGEVVAYIDGRLTNDGEHLQSEIFSVTCKIDPNGEFIEIKNLLTKSALEDLETTFRETYTDEYFEVEDNGVYQEGA